MMLLRAYCKQYDSTNHSFIQNSRSILVGLLQLKSVSSSRSLPIPTKIPLQSSISFQLCIFLGHPRSKKSSILIQDYSFMSPRSEWAAVFSWCSSSISLISSYLMDQGLSVIFRNLLVLVLGLSLSTTLMEDFLEREALLLLALWMMAKGSHLSCSLSVSAYINKIISKAVPTLCLQSDSPDDASDRLEAALGLPLRCFMQKKCNCRLGSYRLFLISKTSADAAIKDKELRYAHRLSRRFALFFLVKVKGGTNHNQRIILCGYLLISRNKQKSGSRGKACHFYTSKINDSEIAANGFGPWPGYLLDIFCLFVSYLFEVIKQMANTAPVLAQTVIDKYIEDLPELPNKSSSCRQLYEEWKKSRPSWITCELFNKVRFYSKFRAIEVQYEEQYGQLFAQMNRFNTLTELLFKKRFASDQDFFLRR